MHLIYHFRDGCNFRGTHDILGRMRNHDPDAGIHGDAKNIWMSPVETTHIHGTLAENLHRHDMD